MCEFKQEIVERKKKSQFTCFLYFCSCFGLFLIELKTENPNYSDFVQDQDQKLEYASIYAIDQVITAVEHFIASFLEPESVSVC